MEFFTVGVYGATEGSFFTKLTDSNIDTFCDIRQRRGVRGAKYAFVNSQKLQEKLLDLDVRYTHVKALAPTKEIRDLQKRADQKNGVLKRERGELGNVFIDEYKNDILSKFDFDFFLESLERMGADRVVLFCVEECHKACHRSIVADRLKEKGYKITHL